MAPVCLTGVAGSLVLLLGQGAGGGAGQCPWEVATAGRRPGLPGNGVPKERVWGKNGKKCELRGKRESVMKGLAPTRKGCSRNRKRTWRNFRKTFSETVSEASCMHPSCTLCGWVSVFVFTSREKKGGK